MLWTMGLEKDRVRMTLLEWLFDLTQCDLPQLEPHDSSAKICGVPGHGFAERELIEGMNSQFPMPKP